MNEYEIFRVIWWAILGVLLIGLAVMDGFDLGAAMLSPIIGKTDTERRVVINTVGPVWEGNQVWLILGGGAIFAAWPMLYAVAFSGFYFAMLLLLVALILRPVGFKYRSKLQGTGWRNFWDGALFIGGLVPALVYGVAFGNVLQGVPFTFDNFLRITYSGTFFGLFNPFALLCGILSVAMLLMHGGAYVACKTEGSIRARALPVWSRWRSTKMRRRSASNRKGSPIPLSQTLGASDFGASSSISPFAGAMGSRLTMALLHRAGNLPSGS